MIRLRNRWRLRQNDVRVCAAESKRVYACQPFTIGFRERLGVRRHAQFQFIEIDVRIRGTEMQAARNFTMLKNQHRFQESGNAGGSFKMANIRLTEPIGNGVERCSHSASASAGAS